MNVTCLDDRAQYDTFQMESIKQMNNVNGIGHGYWLASILLGIQ